MINTGKKHLVHVVKYRWWWMLLTTILLVPGIIAMIYSSVTYANHAPLKVGIDYTGGTILQYGLEQKLNNSDVKIDIDVFPIFLCLAFSSFSFSIS